MAIDYLEEPEALRLLRDDSDAVRKWNKYRASTRWPLPRLSLANLEGLHLAGINLERTYLRGAGFSRSVMSNASFVGSFLRGSDFRDSDLSRAVFDGADLTDSDLRGALLDEASFLGANLQGALLGPENRRVARQAGASFCSEIARSTVPVDIAVLDPDVSEADIQSIEGALARFMDACQFEVESVFAPVLGSWFQKLRFWSKQHVTPADAEEALEEGKQALLAKLERPSLEGTALISEAARNLIESLSTVDVARIHLGQLLILKATVDGQSRVLVETVSSQLARQLRRDPALSRDPARLIQWLDEHRAEQELTEPAAD